MNRPSVRSMVLALAVALPACGGGETGNDAALTPLQREPLEVAAQARLEPAGGFRELGAETAGRIARVHVAAGDTVPVGALLITLSSDVEEAALRIARAELVLARTRRSEARTATEARRPRAMLAARELERVEALFAAGGLSEERRDLARAEASEAALELERAEAQERVVSAALEVASASVEMAAAELTRREIRSPIAGTVVEVGAQEGTVITGFERVVLVRLAPEGPLRALVEVDELFAQRVRTGQRGRILDPATGRELGQGEIVFVAPGLRRKSLFSDLGGELEDRRVREVHLQLEVQPGALIGARVEARISLAGGPTEG